MEQIFLNCTLLISTIIVFISIIATTFIKNNRIEVDIVIDFFLKLTIVLSTSVCLISTVWTICVDIEPWRYEYIKTRIQEVEEGDIKIAIAIFRRHGDVCVINVNKYIRESLSEGDEIEIFYKSRGPYAKVYLSPFKYSSLREVDHIILLRDDK